MQPLHKKQVQPVADKPFLPTEVLRHLENIKKNLTSFKEESIFHLPFTRRLKVQPIVRETDYDLHHTVPSFTLCGEWLKNAGFTENRHVRIIALNELLIIFPEATPLKNSNRL